MLIVPTNPAPSQTLSILLAGQNCQINVYQKTKGMYLDLSINNSPLKMGIRCRDRVLLVRYAYLGFIGDLSFFDTQGTDDPYYTGLGSRYQLVYLSTSDLS